MLSKHEFTFNIFLFVLAGFFQNRTKINTEYILHFKISFSSLMIRSFKLHHINNARSHKYVQDIFIDAVL